MVSIFMEHVEREKFETLIFVEARAREIIEAKSAAPVAVVIAGVV